MNGTFLEWLQQCNLDTINWILYVELHCSKSYRLCLELLGFVLQDDDDL